MIRIWCQCSLNPLNVKNVENGWPILLVDSKRKSSDQIFDVASEIKLCEFCAVVLGKLGLYTTHTQQKNLTDYSSKNWIWQLIHCVCMLPLSFVENSMLCYVATAASVYWIQRKLVNLFNIFWSLQTMASSNTLSNEWYTKIVLMILLAPIE